MLDPLTIARVRRVAGDTPIVVALSGGGDSVALLGLLQAELGAQSLVALVVDHALREGSADDAHRARSFAAELDVTSEVLTVAWPNGVRRGQAAARAARYAVLCARTRALGARVIVAAHTADDQIETVLMRAAGGSSWRGLAGMAALAPAPIWPEGRELWLARPLLGQRRVTLRAYLRARAASWIEDPANRNQMFERVRVRAYVAEREAHGIEVTRLADMAARLRPHLDRIDAEAATLIAQSSQFDGPEIRLARGAWTAPEHVRRRAVSALITAASGAARAPAPDGVERLDRRMQDKNFSGASLGGAVIAPTRGGFRVTRDAGAINGRADGAAAIAPLALEPGRQMVWDGRLELRVADDAWSVAPADGGAQLCRGEARQSIAALIAAHNAEWLLPRRVAHLLAEHN